MAIPLQVKQAVNHLQRILKKAHLGRESGGEHSALKRSVLAKYQGQEQIQMHHTLRALRKGLRGLPCMGRRESKWTDFFVNYHQLGLLPAPKGGGSEG